MWFGAHKHFFLPLFTKDALNLIYKHHLIESQKASYTNSTFDVVISLKNSNTSDLLSLILKLLKPKAIAQLSTANLDNLKASLLLSGFVNITENADGIRCEKPNYEVGSSAKLSFASTNKIGDNAKVAAIWKIDNEDDEIIDADDLLEEEDKVKPDPSTLKGDCMSIRSF